MTPPPEPRTAVGEHGEPISVGESLLGHGAVTRVNYPLGTCLSCGRLVDIERDEGHDAARHAEAAGAPLREALERIDRDGCQNFYGGQRCWQAGRLRDALYGADKWCDACVARAALTATPAPDPLDVVPVAVLDKAIRAHLEEWGEHQCGYDPCGRNIAKQAARLTARAAATEDTSLGNTFDADEAYDFGGRAAATEDTDAQ